MTQQDIALCWFRNDLRNTDNPALHYATRQHQKVLCLYINTGPEKPSEKPPDLAASAWWQQHAIVDLAKQLNGKLLYRRGEPKQVLQDVIQQHNVTAVYWNRAYDPASIQRDSAIKSWLKAQDITTRSFAGSVLFEPWQILKSDGTPYRVFTPFYKACQAKGLLSAMPLPTIDTASLKPVDFDRQAVMADAPQKNWAGAFSQHWQATREAGLEQLASFIQDNMPKYAKARDFPGKPGISRLSPYLHFGQISVREIAAACYAKTGHEPYLRQLVWRDFAHHILYHWPDTIDQPMDERFANFTWRHDAVQLNAWKKGQTGIPMVDAAMRELWHTGYMHNRTRMLVASLLSKHLLIDWRKGAEWFMYTLLDADLANNTMGWQWVAGCGVDAAPYFRIFNPVAQGERFDAQGNYVRHWVPELKQLPDEYLHAPWNAPAETLHAAGVQLGKNYPQPIVDLAEGRKQALAQWESIK